jgi:hypothetical protein
MSRRTVRPLTFKYVAAWAIVGRAGTAASAVICWGFMSRTLELVADGSGPERVHSLRPPI